MATSRNPLKYVSDLTEIPIVKNWIRIRMETFTAPRCKAAKIHPNEHTSGFDTEVLLLGNVSTTVHSVVFLVASIRLIKRCAGHSPLIMKHGAKYYLSTKSSFFFCHYQ